MILSYKDYKEYLAADRKAMAIDGISIFKIWLKGNTDTVAVYRLVRALRRFELIYNRFRKLTPLYLLYKLHFRRLRRSLSIFIEPNVFGPGLNIVHPGYVWADTSTKAGKNCTVLPMVLFGKKKPGLNPPLIFIGDNCYVGAGAVIIGPVKIGNNVTIGAGSVVIHDIADNCVVAGNPAKVIKIKGD